MMVWEKHSSKFMPQCGLLEKAPFRAKRCSYTCSATYCGWPWRSYIPLSKYFQKPPSSLLESSGSLSFHKCRGRAGSKVGHTCGSGSWDLSAVPDSLVVSTFCSGSFLKLLHTHITWYSREVGNLSTGWALSLSVWSDSSAPRWTCNLGMRFT